jgi:hypothetical protein
VSRRLDEADNAATAVNWAGVIAILLSVYCAHWLLKPYQPIEVFTSLICVAVIYPALRLGPFRPRP